jgi:phage repressor protein C with HTH and peptisase S24 domain
VIGKNIEFLRKGKNLSQAKLGKEVDESRSKIDSYESGRAKPKYEVAKKLADFFKVDVEDLYNTDLTDGDTLLNEPEAENYIVTRRATKTQKRKPYMVPLVPVKAQAGYVRAVDQETFLDTMEEYALPPGVSPHGAVWRYWEVEGESMEPAFHSGDFILTSQVHRMDWDNIRNFYLYVIVTSDKVLFKRLFCKNELEWVLISENEEHSPQQLLPIEEVKEVWVFRRHIVNHAPPTKMFKITV